MLQHIFDQRAKITNSIMKSYSSDEEVKDKTKKVTDIIADGSETTDPQFLGMADSDIVGENGKPDNEKKEEVKKSEDRPLAFTSSGKAIFKSKDHDNFQYFDSIDYKDTVELYELLFEKSRTIEERNSQLQNIKFYGEKAVETLYDELSLIKAENDETLQLLDELNSLQKSEEVEELEKSISTKVHKYLKKIGDKYIYHEEEPRKITPIGDLMDYHQQKLGLDSIKNLLDNSSHSTSVRELYKIYNQKARAFEAKNGHKHNSEDATKRLHLVRHGMLTHIDNTIHDNAVARMEKAEQEDDLIKAIIIKDQFEKGGVGSGRHKTGDVLHLKGDESMDLKAGKHTITKVGKEDDEDVYHLKHEDGSEGSYTQDYIHGEGYFKGAGSLVNKVDKK